MSNDNDGLRRLPIDSVDLERQYHRWQGVVALLCLVIAVLLLAAMFQALTVKLPDTYLTTYAGNVIQVSAGEVVND